MNLIRRAAFVLLLVGFGLFGAYFSLGRDDDALALSGAGAVVLAILVLLASLRRRAGTPKDGD